MRFLSVKYMESVDMSRKPAGSPKETVRKAKTKPAPRTPHPAGPHATPELTDEDATPGTGALPGRTKSGGVDPGVG
jgi:hypothetical protein